ncbi:hypothetical protein Tco_0587253, partial [Tanacetum coccineum]
SSLAGENATLTAEVPVLKTTVAQKDSGISLLDTQVTHLTSALDDSKLAYFFDV